MGAWLENQYLKWQVSEGGRRTVEQFAAFLGSSQPYVSMVMRGDRTPSQSTAKKWAERLGDNTILDMLGYRRSDEDLDELIKAFDQATPEQKKAIIDFAFQLIGFEPEE